MSSMPFPETGNRSLRHSGARSYELDALRGLAILSVLLYHFTTRYNQLYGHPASVTFEFSHGYLGVHLFFIISGFVIFMSLGKTAHGLDFVMHRLSKLYPAYWFSIFLTFVIVHIFSLPGREVNLLHALINLSLLQTWLSVPHIDGVYWVLSRFLCFYVLMLLLFNMRQLKSIESISILWLAFIFLNRFSESIFGFALPGIIQLTLLFDFGNLFILGIMFFRIKNKGNTVWRNTIIGLCLLVQWFLADGTTFIIICGFVLLFYLFLWNCLSFIATRPLIFLGKISYVLFLIHQNIGYVVIRYLYRLDSEYMPVIILPTLLSIVLATLITFYIANPATHAIRTLYSRRHLTPA